jgi:hypothetical protein
MLEHNMFPVPFVEAFLMAEDIRNEQNGQMSLIGVFSDCLFTKIWPLRFAKLCFMVRARGLARKCSHSLAVSGPLPEAAIANVAGTLDHVAEKSELAVFNYFLMGLAFDKPGRYVARFSVSDEGKTILNAEYSFVLLIPNPEELYVECSKCHAKFGSGILAKSPSQVKACETVCPQCNTTNALDAHTAFHLSETP